MKLSSKTRGLIALVASLVTLCLLASPLRAQVPSAVGPYNIDLSTLITNTAQPAGIVNSASQNNLDQAGATCTMVMTGFTGYPVVNFSIQGFDTATGSWLSYVTSPAVTPALANTPVVLFVGRSGGVPNPQPTLGFSPFTFPLPANAQSIAVPLTRIWRLQEVINGSGSPTVTAKIGCVLTVN